MTGSANIHSSASIREVFYSQPIQHWSFLHFTEYQFYCKRLVSICTSPWSASLHPVTGSANIHSSATIREVFCSQDWSFLRFEYDVLELPYSGKLLRRKLSWFQGLIWLFAKVFPRVWHIFAAEQSMENFLHENLLFHRLTKFSPAICSWLTSKPQSSEEIYCQINCQLSLAVIYTSLLP